MLIQFWCDIGASRSVVWPVFKAVRSLDASVTDLRPRASDLVTSAVSAAALESISTSRSSSSSSPLSWLGLIALCSDFAVEYSYFSFIKLSFDFSALFSCFLRGIRHMVQIKGKRTYANY